jgi:hypothetical protein
VALNPFSHFTPRQIGTSVQREAVQVPLGQEQVSILVAASRRVLPKPEIAHLERKIAEPRREGRSARC